MEFKPPCAFYEREKQIIKSVFESRTKSPASPRPTPKGHSRRSNAYPPSRRLRPRVVPTPPTRPLARRARARMRYFSRGRAHTHRTSRARPAVDRRRHAERVRRHLAVLGERVRAVREHRRGGETTDQELLQFNHRCSCVVRASSSSSRARRGVSTSARRSASRDAKRRQRAKGRPLVTLRSKRHTAKHRLYTRVDPVYFINYYAYACKLYFYLEYVKTR